ncbi:hypothetical protein NUW54_g5759 [Trametes sanguinea]|uniref:Uncharacterized protein n=1 Tax=Trametes sanguinea TaxID=158606 RepID=A0ACC1PVR2_9APHY|nr:hypothetical protein NUW54_g5759 [Trametes sanguinea]
MRMQPYDGEVHGHASAERTPSSLRSRMLACRPSQKQQLREGESPTEKIPCQCLLGQPEGFSLPKQQPQVRARDKRGNESSTKHPLLGGCGRTIDPGAGASTGGAVTTV